ncbi:MAG TPA: glycosidase [Candidatus Marinimicrobia bacterium]|nr:glycosidase [Candidatus Neomarinimicrobiota bacterium]
MAIKIKRKSVKFLPDPKRVIALFLNLPGNDKRVAATIKQVLNMSDEETTFTLTQVLRNFSNRHRNITTIFENHFKRVEYILETIGVDARHLSKDKKLLIGSYFTMEYSVESAAFFNPSIVEHPDQTDLEEGQKRVILSFRATGEGHISSIAFRSGIIDIKNDFHFKKPGPLVDVPEVVKRHVYDKKMFMKKLDEMNIHKDIIGLIMDKLGDKFIYGELQASIAETMKDIKPTYGKKKVIQEINWLADSHYEVTFSLDTSISERVIYPVSYSESNGIEDARFVRLVDDDGSVTYYATYTAYDGFAILPKLIGTKDFYHFKDMPINGEYAQNKCLALFPRKIKGQYVMLARIDGVNNYIMFSNKINLWREAQMIQEPEYPWEFIQIGNCGSPIETEKGWLVITHGVGPMRKYCLGAVLLDLEDPTKVIGKLREPLLSPNEEEREGYVPNVIYSCGSIIHNNELIIPYAMADYGSTFATVPLDELLDELLKPAAVSKNSKSRASILLVDDDPDDQFLIMENLKDSDFQIDVANDGISALMSIARKHYDLVLSDIRMPNFDGIHLLKYMKKNNIKIPVILMTGQSSDEIKDCCDKLGASGFLKKPFKNNNLLGMIEKALKKR